MPAIDRTSPTPLWAQLLADLRRRLDVGEFGASFPSDTTLVEEYGVSRQTVRDAVRRLHDEGLLSRERGRGTFVRRPGVDQPWGALYSLHRSVEGQGSVQRSRVLDLSETTDGEVCRRLGLPRTTKLIRLERIRMADDEPMARDTAWLPARIARPLLRVDFTHTALYDELTQRCGIVPTHATEWIGAQIPGPDDRRLLGLAARQPAFFIERMSYMGDQPLEWRTTLVRSDRYGFVARWSGAQRYDVVLEPRAHRGTGG